MFVVPSDPIKMFLWYVTRRFLIIHHYFRDFYHHSHYSHWPFIICITFPNIFQSNLPLPQLFPLLLLPLPLYCHNICHCPKMVLSPCLSSNHHSHFLHCFFTFLLSSSDLNQYIPKPWWCRLIHKITYTFNLKHHGGQHATTTSLWS